MALPALLESMLGVFENNPWQPAQTTVALIGRTLSVEPAEKPGPLPGDQANVISQPPLLGELTTDGQEPWIVALRENVGELTWYGSSRSGGSAYAQLVGPEAPWPRDDLRVGIFMVRANYTYPPHVHAADEIYYVAAGDAQWACADEEFVRYERGQSINIPSMTTHAIRTRDKPVLTFYSWTGDVSLDSYRFVST